MRFAYADPPYLGKCGKFYEHNHPDGRCWNDLSTHQLLIERLQEDYPDGWALSCASTDLRVMLPLCPAEVRVAAWVKPFCAFKKGVRPAYAWEPVLFADGRNKNHPPPPQGRDADDTEGLHRRADHAETRAHRGEAGSVLPVGARPAWLRRRHGRD